MATRRMTALSRFHYPSGPTGRDYKAGDEFEALTDRDVKALTLLRRAKVVLDEPVPARAFLASKDVARETLWQQFPAEVTATTSTPEVTATTSTPDVDTTLMTTEFSEPRKRRKKSDESEDN